MNYQVTIFIVLLITTAASAQSEKAKPMVPKGYSSPWTFEKIIENLWTAEGFIKCDRKEYDETNCLKLDIRKEMASATADLIVADPEFDNKDYLIEFSVDGHGAVVGFFTYNASGMIQLDKLINSLEQLNPIPRRELAVNPKTHLWRVVDYFEIRDGKIIIPPGSESR